MMLKLAADEEDSSSQIQASSSKYSVEQPVDDENETAMKSRLYDLQSRMGITADNELISMLSSKVILFYKFLLVLKSKNSSYIKKMKSN
jgi:hypothetical protein